LSDPAPNIIEWVTGLNYWNVPSTFDHWRQYQILRDAFLTRCPLCNSMKPDAVDVWGKSRQYLESETLLVWQKEHNEFVCPKCKTTQYELIEDGFFPRYNEAIIIAGMRSGKSYLGAHIGGYIEHMLSSWGVEGKHTLQRIFHQEKSEWFEVTFAASTATQAQETIYAKYREMRNNSPWVNRYIRWVREKEKKQLAFGRDAWTYKSNDDSIRDGWLQVRFNRIASDSRGIAGKTRISAAIDEWARLIDSDGTRSALELYRVLNQSLKTIRASVTLNRLPPFLGYMMNVTSPIAQDDPAMLMYNMARDGELKRCYGWKGATWEFNPFMPRSEFDEEFAKDAVGAERDFGANPPLATSPYIDDPQRFWQCIDWNTRPMVDYQLKYIQDPTGVKYIGADAKDCIVEPYSHYYIFADAGQTWDSFSFAIGRPKYISVSEAETFSETSDHMDAFDVQDVIREEHKDAPPGMISIRNKEVRNISLNKKLMEHSESGEALVTEVVSVFRIVPTKEREIWFESIVDIVKYLRQKINIAGFGSDNWNSVSTIQDIRNLKIPATSVTLRLEDFMEFRNLAYSGRVIMLPPHPDDKVKLLSNGSLSMGVAQPQMHPESVGLVELLKLSRSDNLKRIYNEKKGAVRGQDSDDLARCIIGLNHLVQHSILDAKAQSPTHYQKLQRIKSLQNANTGQVYISKRGY
jgi:hypothetical protein